MLSVINNGGTRVGDDDPRTKCKGFPGPCRGVNFCKNWPYCPNRGWPAKVTGPSLLRFF